MAYKKQMKKNKKISTESAQTQTFFENERDSGKYINIKVNNNGRNINPKE